MTWGSAAKDDVSALRDDEAASLRADPRAGSLQASERDEATGDRRAA